MFILIGISILGFVTLGYQKAQAVVEENLDSWTRFDDLFKKYDKKWGVNWKWLKAIAMSESLLGKEKSVKAGLENPKDIEGSKSSDGLSWGLMQVTVKTAKDMDASVTPEKLNNPEYSINLAAWYVSKLKKYYSTGDPRYLEWVIKSYNQGPGNTAKEKSGAIKKGYADEYWTRFQNNLKRVG